MAKLVAVCRDDEFHFDRRQIPLMIEETLTMVMEIPETVISAECVTSSIDVSQFLKKYSCLSHEEMSSALMVSKKELFALLSMSVPCVGCRRSVERLYDQLWKSGQPALEPLTISASGVLTLSSNFLEDAKLIYALFYIHGTHLNDVVDTIPKSKRNKRCILHSLETHKAARASGWMDVWDLLSQECRDEVVLIDSDSLLDTLETYLRKHRFCSECKSKVLKAYSILAGDTDGDSEKGYCATLYEGLKSCPKERHIHVVCDTDFIAHLIGRAEPELAGGRRERHARTIDIAQEEVLTCLGIHLWERLHRLWQKLRAEEQTWQILFYLGVEALRKRFETAVEEKQGISQLELVVEEISEAEKAKEQRRENKRLKRKKRKENKAKSVEDKCIPIEEKYENIENDEKCSEGTISSAEKECFESTDDCSEKSSCDSQVSPGKTDPQCVSSSSPKLSPCSSAGDSVYGLLKPVQAVEEEKVSTCTKAVSNKCSNGYVSSKSSCPNVNAENCSEDLSCKDCDSDSNSPWLEQNCRKGDPCRPNNQFSKYRSNTNNDCECDTGKPSSGNRRNGLYTNHDNNRVHYKNGHKRNGYHDCRSSSSVGPRFSRYESQNRWKNELSDSNHSNDNQEACLGHNEHGKGGKRTGKSTNKCKDSQLNVTQTRDPKRQSSSTCNGKIDEHVSHPPVVEDEDELRLLKMMGWNNEDSLCLSEQEIQEFKANKSDVQSRRKELRDKLRDQFQKLCVISAN